jgi:hypothetical protein
MWNISKINKGYCENAKIQYFQNEKGYLDHSKRGLQANQDSILSCQNFGWI